MTRSSLTEETPATPGWVDARIQTIFAPLGDSGVGIRDAYAECLAGVRGSVDVDFGHDRCRATVLKAAAELVDDIDALDRALQALEVEITSET